MRLMGPEMDYHIKEYYKQFSDEAPHGNFHSVVALHEAPDVEWDEISERVPELCRGWYELSRLSRLDRIEFTRDFWLAKLPYFPGSSESINHFFASLDEIGVFLTQKKFEDPFEAHLVYSIKDNSGFFRGAPPITEKKYGVLEKY